MLLAKAIYLRGEKLLLLLLRYDLHSFYYCNQWVLRFVLHRAPLQMVSLVPDATVQPSLGAILASPAAVAAAACGVAVRTAFVRTAVAIGVGGAAVAVAAVRGAIASSCATTTRRHMCVPSAQ